MYHTGVSVLKSFIEVTYKKTRFFTRIEERGFVNLYNEIYISRRIYYEKL